MSSIHPSLSSLAEWNERFAIPGIAQIVEGRGGLPKVSVTAPAASAEIYLHGAQVTSWQPAGGDEVLFVSERSRWEEGRAIRGGVPICFPWFRAKADDAKAPAHGLVRTRQWQLDSLERAGEEVSVSFSLESDEAMRQWWPHAFRIEHRVTVGATLTMELVVCNTGAASMRFEEALHTYHRVGDAAQVRIRGLDGISYLDNMDDNRERLQHGDVTFAGQTDSAFLGTLHGFEILDPVLRRRVRTRKEGSSTSVVWNPWVEGAASLADLGAEEWRQMACAEASNIMDFAVDLKPKERYTMRATLSVADSGASGEAAS